MRAAAIVVAAGRGERLGEPKAFSELAGRPLLQVVAATIEGCPDVEAFVVAAPPGREEEAASLAASAKLVTLVSGGETRQASVRLGLSVLPEWFDAVIVHDVARPLAGPDLYSAVLAALAGADGAVPLVAVPDTVKRLRGAEVVETVAREGLGLVQTPQAFRRQALEAAHRAAEREGFAGTDDAALLERAGYRVVAVPGDPTNLKVTTQSDLRVAEALLAARESRARAEGPGAR